MKKYRILYYAWGEYTMQDATTELQRLGHEVTVAKDSFGQYDEDEKFITSIINTIKKQCLDLIFSFNYYPDLSRAALQAGVIYVSWCFDSPNLTLQSVTLGNSCNRVFLFDRANCEQLRMEGFSNVFYMPLACNVARLERLFANQEITYQHELSFVGNLYDDKYNFYQQINYLPEYLRGYLDAVMEAQLPIYGYDMVRYLLRDDVVEKMLQYVKLDMGQYYRVCPKDILAYMVQKQITVNERRRLLTVLGEYYPVDLYSSKKPEAVPVHYHGMAEYQEQMPKIFRSSKINLNITLRTIQTGLPLRIIDILGAGGFLLTNYQAELPEYFEKGKDLVWYESYEELFELVAYYLDHDTQREKIAQNGHKIAKEQFSYEILLHKIFSQI
ncbi:MAG: DUF3880 domain-containing protein [Lachnospiraceae bacterium]